MKYTLLLLLCLCLCFTAGCTPASETPTQVSSAVGTSQTQSDVVTLDIPYNRYWTWNDLYDYLESPLQSGNLSFDAETQTLRLLEADGQTKVTDWATPLEDGMVAVLCDQNGKELRRFVVHITNQPEQPKESSSQTSVPSVVSIPEASQSDNPSSVSSQPREKVQITLRGKSNKTLKKVVEAFNKQSQTVSVTLTDGDELVSAAGLRQEGNTALCPDVVMMDYSQYQVAIKKGLLTAFSKTDREPFGLPADHSTHGVLLGKEAFCTAANQDVLYHCNVDLPQEYDQLIETAKQVKQTLPKTIPLGVVTAKEDPVIVATDFVNLLTASGGSLLTPDCEVPAFYSHVGVQVMNNYATYLEEGIIAENYGADDFTKGNTAFGRVSSKRYEEVFGKKARHNYQALPLMLPNQSGGMTQSYYYCIPKNENKDKSAAAYEFLTYLLTDVDTLSSLCKTAGLVPAHPEVRKCKYYQSDAWQILMEEADRGFDPPALDCMDTLYGYLTESVLAVLDGENSDTALAKAHALTEGRLARQ